LLYLAAKLYLLGADMKYEAALIDANKTAIEGPKKGSRIRNALRFWRIL